jgi:hypothetical protein
MDAAPGLLSYFDQRFRGTQWGFLLSLVTFARRECPYSY